MEKQYVSEEIYRILSVLRIMTFRICDPIGLDLHFSKFFERTGHLGIVRVVVAT